MIGALACALLFGGTCMGIDSLVLSMAGRYYPTRPAKMMGKLTITYGVAQIIGPAITAQIAAIFGNYSSGLYIAAGVMVLGSFYSFYLEEWKRSMFSLGLFLKQTLSLVVTGPKRTYKVSINICVN